MSEAPAARTRNRATTAMRTSPVACLPEIVKLMRTLSGNSNEVSVADLAEDREMPGPEKAFVCASLRNFGRIVMVTCMLEDYRQAKQLAREQPDDDAFRAAISAGRAGRRDSALPP